MIGLSKVRLAHKDAECAEVGREEERQDFSAVVRRGRRAPGTRSVEVIVIQVCDGCCQRDERRRTRTAERSGRGKRALGLASMGGAEERRGDITHLVEFAPGERLGFLTGLEKRMSWPDSRR
jgi:hypothetical protein